MTNENKGKAKHSEYLNARREWNERYGSYISREAWWRWCSFFCLAVLVIAVSGLIFLSSKTKFVPYLVELDKVGNSRAVGFVEKINYKDTRVVRSEIVSFISNIRLITTDTQVQKKAIKKVYQHLLSSYPATRFVNNFYQKNNSFKLSLKQKTVVQVKSILPISDKTWQLEWDEQIFNLQGQHIKTISMKASINIVFHTPENENDILENPIGMYIKELSWTKIV